jgi:hypothetical protein
MTIEEHTQDVHHGLLPYMSPRRLNQSTHGAEKMELVLLHQPHVVYLHPEEHDALLKPEEDEALAISE